MKLVSARVTNFRSILDSNEVPIGQMTCLVGKNEAGKTAFLKALEGLRSTDTSYKEYTKTENYPRRYLADYDDRHPDAEALVVETKWEMTTEDVSSVESVLGTGVLLSKNLKISKRYEKESSEWELQFDDRKALQNLIEELLPLEDAEVLAEATSTQEASAILAAKADKTPDQSELLTKIKSFRGDSAHLKAIDILSKRTPKFLYFSHYDRMSGELSVQKLQHDKQNSRPVSSGDQVFLDFLTYSGTTLEELISTNRFESLNAKCEAASLRITDEIFEYWTQNDQLEVNVLFNEGKPEDPPPFNSGPVARARIKNKIHGVSVPFSERSAGFIWFFSFLVKFAQIKKTYGNAILLLDEPGLTLHGTAQKDLLRYFREKIAPQHQLIYSTHSPFLVPADEISCVRTVEDVVKVDSRGRKESFGTKVRDDVLATDPQTNFPLVGAIGFEVTQTLIIGKNTLLVEGPSDILYLQTASNILKQSRRPHLSPLWAPCPAGSIDKILPFIKLFHGNNLNIVVLTDYDRGQKRKLEDLYRSALLEEQRIILATEIAGKEEADIEDFFEPELFVDLLNATYNLAPEHALTVEKLMGADENTTRLVKKAEAYFRLLPATVPEFNHFEPSMHLLRNPELLTAGGEASAKSLARFEAAFEKVEKFLLR